MKKYFYLVLILPLLFSSCKKDDQNAIRGTWEFKSGSITLSPPNAETLSPPNVELEKMMNKNIKKDFGKREIRFYEGNSYVIPIPHTGNLKDLTLSGNYSYEKQTLILKNPNFYHGELVLSASIINNGKSLRIINTRDAAFFYISEDSSDNPFLYKQKDKPDKKDLKEQRIDKIRTELIFEKK